MPLNEDGFFHGIYESPSKSEALQVGSYTLPSGETVGVTVLGYTVEYEAEPSLFYTGDWEIRDMEVWVIREELILTRPDGTEILGDGEEDLIPTEVWEEVIIHAQRQIASKFDEDLLLRDLYESL